GGFFTDAEPDAMLTQVHRQAQDDPIVRLSMAIRAGNPLAQGRYGASEVVRRDALDPARVIGADQILVGRNATRRAYNARLRERRGFADALPMAGDKLVCLRNNRRKGLFNGGLPGVKERPRARRQIIRMRLKPDEELSDRMIKVSVRPECFTGAIEALDWPARKPYDEFDFGYVLTIHKAQGSQWDDVVLFDESGAFPDNRDRWLYTGVTRAAKRLTVVVCRAGIILSSPRPPAPESPGSSRRVGARTFPRRFAAICRQRRAPHRRPSSATNRRANSRAMAAGGEARAAQAPARSRAPAP